LPKPSTKEAMLREGLLLCLVDGFLAASVRDITRAAGAPLGSFANHFASKEAFGMEILDLYRDIWRQRFAVSILDEKIPPRDGFARFFDDLRADMEKFGWKAGCLLGHFSLEVSSLSNDFRMKLREAHEERHVGFAAALRRAVETGDADPDIDCDGLAEFLDEALQGALMKVRVEQSSGPYDRFRKNVFSTILRPKD
jgi:TetR/AcrR family transcriptional regulator, transcriptional repressor for nem operon